MLSTYHPQHQNKSSVIEASESTAEKQQEATQQLEQWHSGWVPAHPGTIPALFISAPKLRVPPPPSTGTWDQVPRWQRLSQPPKAKPLSPWEPAASNQGTPRASSYRHKPGCWCKSTRIVTTSQVMQTHPGSCLAVLKLSTRIPWSYLRI